jgi:acetolactate synthase-1/2/3 large subunit
MGSMGFALPAAIGACFSTNKSPIVMIAGDGGFQCNLQELQTVVRNRLPIKMVIINNGCLGMVRQFQESYFDCHYQSTIIGYDAPDFSAVANAYGIPARIISMAEESVDGCNWLWGTGGPALLHVIVSSRANAYPKIAFGSPLTIMEPDR